MRGFGSCGCGFRRGRRDLLDNGYRRCVRRGGFNGRDRFFHWLDCGLRLDRGCFLSCGRGLDNSFRSGLGSGLRGGNKLERLVDTVGVLIHISADDGRGQDAALAVHKEGGRNGGEGEKVISVLGGDQVGIMNAGLVQNGLGKLRIAFLARVQADADELAVFRLQLVAKLRKLRQLPLAGAAPGRPEIDHGDIVIFEKLRAGDGGSVQIRRLKGDKIADLKRLRLLRLGQCQGVYKALLVGAQAKVFLVKFAHGLLAGSLLLLG